MFCDSVETLPAEHIYDSCKKKKSTVDRYVRLNLSSYDWSKGGRRLVLLSDQVKVDWWVNTASEAAVCFSFPMTVNVVLNILLKHEHDRLLSFTTW